MNNNAVIYPAKIEFDPTDQLYVVDFLDLPGCSAHGATVEEAYQRAEEAKEEWIKATKEQGLPVPPPTVSTEHSGRILLRLPTSLHGMLADRAKIRGASLNQYLVHLLSGAAVGDSVESSINRLRADFSSFESRVLSRLPPRWPAQPASVYVDSITRGVPFTQDTATLLLEDPLRQLQGNQLTQ